jgi:hypothetical protein
LSPLPGASHAVAAVGAHAVLGVHLARDDTDVEVVLGALAPVRALAQRACADLVGGRPVRVFPDTEQPARLLALATKFL